MIRNTILIVFMSMGVLTSHAHDSKAAFFSIKETENAVIIEAEFPWTIRNALFEFNPELVNSKDEAFFESSFFEYVESSFKITSKYNNLLKLVSVTEHQKKGHSHQTNYTFKFEKDEISKISNSLMFNISDKQRNHHTFLTNPKPLKFETSINESTFNINQIPIRKNYNWIIIVSLVVVGLILIVIINKKEFL